MRADRLIAELQAHEPQVLAAVRRAIDLAEADADFLRLDPEAFAAAPSISIDHAVMERTARAAVVAADFAWSDIGSWSAVWEVQTRDADGNAHPRRIRAQRTPSPSASSSPRARRSLPAASPGSSSWPPPSGC